MNKLTHTSKFIKHINCNFPDMTSSDIKKPISYYTFKTWEDVLYPDSFYSDGLVTYYGFISDEDELFFVYTIPEKIIDFNKIVESARMVEFARAYKLN